MSDFDAHTVLLIARHVYQEEEMLSVPISTDISAQEESLSRGEEGIWVKAWVYLSNEVLEGARIEVHH